MRVAVFQSCTPGLTPAARLEVLDQSLSEADVELLVCPELFMSGYAAGEDIRKYAEPTDGAFAAGIAKLAQEHDTAVVYGYPELLGDSIYNAAQCIDASGSPIANHRKLILPPSDEGDYFDTGTRLTLFQLDDIRFGLVICYDAEFPETVRALAKAGAQAVIVPTATGAQWGVVSDRVMPARAFENGIYLLYANHAGKEGDLTYLGASCIVGPDGKDLARATDIEAIITAEVDPSEVTTAQERLPFLRDVANLNRRLNN